MLKFEFKSDEILDYSVAHNSTEIQIKYIFNSDMTLLTGFLKIFSIQIDANFLKLNYFFQNSYISKLLKILCSFQK